MSGLPPGLRLHGDRELSIYRILSRDGFEHLDGPIIIAHVCTTSGRWGGEAARAITQRWLGPERAYTRDSGRRAPREGALHAYEVEPGVVVANLIASRTGPGDVDPKLFQRAMAELGELRRQRLSHHWLALCLNICQSNWDAVISSIETTQPEASKSYYHIWLTVNP